MKLWYFTCTKILATTLQQAGEIYGATGTLYLCENEKDAMENASKFDKCLCSAVIPNSCITELISSLKYDAKMSLSDWNPDMLGDIRYINQEVQEEVVEKFEESEYVEEEPPAQEDKLPLNSEPELFSYLDKAPVNSDNLVKYEKLILFTYSGYVKKRETIQRGFLSGENVEWLIEHLYLNEATDDELNEIWFAIDLFFRRMMFTVDSRGELQWRQDEHAKDIMWWMDCDSAWKEVVNHIARKRRGK